MKRFFKRTLAVLIAVIMLVGVAPLGAFATQEQPQQATTQNATVNATDDFSRIVMSKVEADNENKEMYGITELSIKNKTATVNLTAPDDCTLVVAIYTENMQMLGYGITKINSESNEYTVSLSDVTFPEYYIVKGFILDKNNAAVCDEYVNREQTKAFENFMNTTTDDFDSDLVLNFDDDKTNNFAVLSEDITVLDSSSNKNVIKSYDESTDTYVINNADSTLKNLKSGETFYLSTGAEQSDYIIVTADSIKTNGNTVTIVSDEETVEDVFDCIKIDSTGGLTDESIKNAELGSALTLDEPAPQTRGDVNVDGDFSKTLGTQINYTAAQEGGNSVKISGSLSLTLSISCKIYYDKKWFADDYFEYEFSHTETLELKGSVTGKISVDREKVQMGLNNIPIPSTPLTFSVNVFPVIEFSASISISVTCTNKFTQTYNPYDGQREVQEKDKDWDLDIGVGFSFKFGFGVAIELKAVKIISLELSASAGLDVSGEVDGYLSCLLNEYHYCHKCIEGSIDFFVEVKLTLSIKITKKLKWDLINWTIAEVKFKLTDFYISTYLGGKTSGFSVCPNKLYKVTFTCLENDEPLENITIDLGEGQADTNADGKLDSNTVKTDKNGKASGYYKLGVYKATVKLDDTDIREETFFVDGSTPQIEIKKTSVNNPDDPDNPDDPINPIDPNDPDNPLDPNTSVGDIITFGSYPQSRVTDSQLVITLTNNNPVNSSWVSYGYYSGTGDIDDGNMAPSDYMKYKDVTYNGVKYRGVYFTSYRPWFTGYTSSTSNTYQDNNGYYTNTAYWFKYEPLTWRVLDPSEGFVMCNKAIDSQAYQNVVYYNSSKGDYYNGKDSNTYASDWKTSSIKEWLNNDFYNTAFTASEKSKIGTSHLENKSTYRSEYDSPNTNDKIFLLSYWDVKNSSYGFNSDTDRQIKSTDYAQAQGCGTSTSTSYRGNSWWRLRSPDNSDYTAYVNGGGNAYNHDRVYDTGSGVVPAFKFNPKSTITKSKAADKINIEFDSVSDEPKITGVSYSACVAGGEYILLNVLNYDDSFKLNDSNLLYIDQLTADKNGRVDTTMRPIYTSADSTTLLIGDFGNGIEAKQLQPTATYKAKLIVDGKVYKELYYNEGQKELQLPSVPEKAGFTGEWEQYTLTKGGIEINAVYTPIIVNKAVVKSVSLSDIKLNYKKSTTLNPQITADDGASYTVSYTSSNPKVASVDENGNVKANKKGSAQITVTVTDTNGNTVTDTCNVKVNYNFGQWLLIILLFGWIWYI